MLVGVGRAEHLVNARLERLSQRRRQELGWQACCQLWLCVLWLTRDPCGNARASEEANHVSSKVVAVELDQVV